MEIEALKRIGFSESEIKVYMSLLKLGKANVGLIAESSGVHRTNIYSILDKLKEMGLVSEVKQENKKFFSISDPSNLLNYLKESEEAIERILPNLNKIKESVKEKIEVEFFQGEKGMKSVFKDIIRTKKEVVGFGMTGQLRKYMPNFSIQWIRDIKHYKIKNKYIYVKGTEINESYFEVKTLSKEFATPVGTQIYGDKVLITIWEPVSTAILIKSKEVAENYKKHFELLWKMAK